MRTKLVVLLEKVRQEVKKAQRVAESSHEDATSIAFSLQGSRSTAGDHFHAKHQVEMNKNRLRNLLKLQMKLEEAVNKSVPEVVEPPCFVNESYLVNTPVNIDGFSFISTASPAGQKLLGKKVGEMGIEVLE
ncbi:hypothetical protein A2630_02890 [Candidatus Woesebacteria bacterium RIFCSPHIGHO2_01_FULL_44_10]|uniref:Uncharacterized protein n=1 Tax=Candidatus Woesebacteria bacterium RIFCSPLOWO2_01_FULL_44_14 TaxID=1802525 RepID=A0A1F8C4C2_9BACT|nr:MAG: hypothetical protein A2630_02890 [Candidatus Woesebacteria bacterium RIFCSPHIGHO2_01_FULL_44_10]OGM55730.1 MAG: hypothetical protein A3F62_04585 [Candidatus Woesebacteria bacterium RIFCSPHIGHO2_12_FULL_44_11]OGM70515.1 MAG: hypothetical protein A2975_01920 [Candidatus Woesebacteria bacterium RIFCSPLOWO2_01_FULL_44_14]